MNNEAKFFGAAAAAQPAKRTSSLGIAGIAIGLIACVFGVVPFLGLIAIPFAVVGGVLAFIALIIAVTRGTVYTTAPIIGLGSCFAALVISIASTGHAASQVSQAVDEARAKTKQATAQQALPEAMLEVKIQRVKQSGIDNAHIDYAVTNTSDKYGIDFGSLRLEMYAGSKLIGSSDNNLKIAPNETISATAIFFHVDDLKNYDGTRVQITPISERTANWKVKIIE